MTAWKRERERSSNKGTDAGRRFSITDDKSDDEGLPGVGLSTIPRVRMNKSGYWFRREPGVAAVGIDGDEVSQASWS